jgi:hypothetical protein
MEGLPFDCGGVALPGVIRLYPSLGFRGRGTVSVVVEE